MRLSGRWAVLAAALLLSWYLGWLAPLKGLYYIAGLLWQGVSALKHQDPGPADNSMIAALRNATGSDFNQVLLPRCLDLHLRCLVACKRLMITISHIHGS